MTTTYISVGLDDEQYAKLQIVLEKQRLTYKQFMIRCLAKFDDSGNLRKGAYGFW